MTTASRATRAILSWWKRRRSLVVGAPLLLLLALLPGGRGDSFRHGWSLGLLDWLAGDAGRELAAPEPVRRFAPRLRPAPRRLVTWHHGPIHPARAALSVGDETWVATPTGVLRFGPDLWSSPARARPRGRCEVGPSLSSPGVNQLRDRGEDAIELATDDGVLVVDARCRRRAALERSPGRTTSLGDTLIGTFAGLLPRRHSAPPLLPAVPVTAVAGCGGTTAFVATHDRGLLLWHSGRALPVPGLESGRVAALSRCRRGEGGPEVLAAATAGLFQVRAGRATLVPGSPLHATAVLPLGADLLVGSFDEGLLLLRAGARRAVPVPGRVSLLHRGPGGAVLVGSDRGLFVWQAGQGAARLAVDGPPPGPVTALAQDGDDLWVGTFDAGLARLHGGAWETVPVFDSRITALHRDPGGGLWVGTASGLGRLLRSNGSDDDEARVVRVPDRRGWFRRHVASLRGGGPEHAATLWVAVHPGLVAVDTELDPPELQYLGARGKEADAGLPGPTIYAVAPHGDGLWVGSDDGLGRVTPSGPRPLTDLGGVLPDNWVNDVRSEGEALVVLTLRSGLLRLSPAGSEVFASEVMTSPGVLLVLGGRVLFGSNASGLVALEERGGRGPELFTYGPAEGLPSTMVTSLLHDPDRDRLWVGGSAGVTCIESARRALGLRRTGTDFATLEEKER